MDPSNIKLTLNIPIGAGDGSFSAVKLPKRIVIEKVSLVDNAGLAASNTDYVSVALRSGATVIAETDTRITEDGALVALTHKPMNLVTAQLQREADDELKVVATEGGAGALTAATVQIDYYIP